MERGIVPIRKSVGNRERRLEQTSKSAAESKTGKAAGIRRGGGVSIPFGRPFQNYYNSGKATVMLYIEKFLPSDNRPIKALQLKIAVKTFKIHRLFIKREGSI